MRDLFSVDFPWIYFGKSERCLGIIQEFKFKKLSPQIKISKKKKKKKQKKKKKKKNLRRFTWICFLEHHRKQEIILPNVRITKTWLTRSEKLQDMYVTRVLFLGG